MRNHISEDGSEIDPTQTDTIQPISYRQKKPVLRVRSHVFHVIKPTQAKLK